MAKDFELCYRNTGNKKYLEKAFEFIERSKVAGLLTATRELNAIQLTFLIFWLNRKRHCRGDRFYNARIMAEYENEPDYTLISEWNENY